MRNYGLQRRLAEARGTIFRPRLCHFCFISAYHSSLHRRAGPAVSWGGGGTWAPTLAYHYDINDGPAPTAYGADETWDCGTAFQVQSNNYVSQAAYLTCAGAAPGIVLGSPSQYVFVQN